MSRERHTAEEDEGGLSGRRLVETAWKAFQAARQGLGVPVPDLGELDEEYAAAFAAACSAVRDYIFSAADSDGQFSAATAAAVGADAFYRAMGVESETRDPGALIPFEAVVRHTVNALAWHEEDHGDLADHESAWSSWAASRAGRNQGA